MAGNIYLTRRAVLGRFFIAGASLAAAPLLQACAGAPPTPTPAPAPKPAAPAAAAPTPTPAPAPKPAAPPTTAPTAPTPTPAPAKAVEKPSAAVVEISFMNRGGKQVFDVHDQVIAGFMKDTPNIKIRVEPVLEGAWDVKLLAAIASNTAPDTVNNAFGTWQAFAKRGQFVDMSDYIKRDLKLEEYLPYANQCELYKGKFFSWHYNGGAYAVFYNKEIFDKDKIPYPDASWTWAKYYELAQKLTIDRNGKRPGESGFDPKKIQQYGSGNYPLGAWFHQVQVRGAEVFNAEKTKILFDDAKVPGTIQDIADMQIAGGLWPNTLYPDATPSGFVTGRVAMAPQGHWSVYGVLPAKFPWDVAPMPKNDAGKRIGLGWYSGNSILATTKFRDASWEFLKFFGGPKGQLIQADGGITYPAVISVAKAWKPEHPRNAEAWLMDLENMRVHEFLLNVTEYSKFMQVLTPELEKVWTGQAKAKDVLPPIIPKLNAVLAEN
ncbi:MAG: sugar ABC transporter substrate-binding protein [Chloroflexi bacterium]|nr:sugar ABC transporter substrate-binding protein [Chloroflexota bacterium]